MSGILTRARLIAQERYDLEDLAVDQNATKTDGKFWAKQFLSGENHILKGFQITGLGLKVATVVMANATLIHPENTFDFSWFTAEESPTDITIPDASLTDGVKNYVELRLIEETNTPLTKAFWDPAANGGLGAEFNQEIDTITDLAVEAVVSTGGFSGSADRLKLAIVDVDGTGDIVGILDKRDLFFEHKDFTWATQEEAEVTLTLSGVSGTFLVDEIITFSGGATAIVSVGGTTSIKARTFSSDSFTAGNTVTGGTSGASGTLDDYSEAFIGADKDIDDIKEALDATWTEIKAMKGTTQWYTVVNSSLSGIASFISSQIAAETKGALYRWNGSDFSIGEILRPEVTSLLARADVGGDLDQKYFITYDQNGSVGFWIDVDDSGSTIPAGAAAADRSVEITTIGTNDNISTVATKLQIAINADSEYTVTIDTDTLTITDNVNGPRVVATDGDTGFTIARVQEGLGNITPAGADVLAKLRLFGINNELDLTRQDGSGGSIAIPISDKQVIFIKIPSDGADRVYSGVGVGDTNYQVIDADSYEVKDENYWIAYRENTEIYVRDLGRLQSGDESGIGGGVTEDTLTYIGANSPTDSAPNYLSTEFITQGANLTQTIGELDGQAAINLDITNQDRNINLIAGGTFSWVVSTKVVAWSADAQIQVPGLADARNNIIAASAVLAVDNDVAYVSINRTTGATANLSVTVAQIDTVALTDDIVIIARRVGNIVIVNDSMLLVGGETNQLYSSISTQIRTYLGATDASDQDPSYASTTTGSLALPNFNTIDGEDLPTKISKMNSMLADTKQDYNLEFEPGVITWNGTNITVTNAFLSINGTTIGSGEVLINDLTSTALADNSALYVDISRTSGTALTLASATLVSLTPSQQRLVLIRNINGTLIVR